MNAWTRKRQRRIAMSVKPLRALAQKVLQRLGQPEVEFGLVFVSDRQIRRLNKKYRGIDSSTDVLAFTLALDPQTIKGKGQTLPPLLGDVVISLETARRQAREKHRALYREVARLLIHGTLHLLGYDHEEARDTRRMRRKERELAKELLETR